MARILPKLQENLVGKGETFKFNCNCNYAYLRALTLEANNVSLVAHVEKEKKYNFF